ncbi:MAG: Rnase Y domain-containing protein, partial [Planctomycetota bacterium]
MLTLSILIAAIDPTSIAMGAVVGLVIGAVAITVMRNSKDRQTLGGAEAEAKALLDKTNMEAEGIRKDAEIAAKEASLKQREEAAEEDSKRRRELGDLEVRLG